MAQHTPAPWKVYHETFRPQLSSMKVIEVQTKWSGKAILPWTGFDACDFPKGVQLENAKQIVRCVNSHDALLAAAIHAEAVMSIVEPRGSKKEYLETLEQLRSAIARAKR